MDKKIADFGRFFREKSDFDGAGKDIGMEKSEEKKSVKNRRFFLEIFFSDFFPASDRFRTHPKCLKVTPFNHQTIDYTYYI